MSGFRVVFKPAVLSSSRTTGEGFVSNTRVNVCTAMGRATRIWKKTTCKVAHRTSPGPITFFSDRLIGISLKLVLPTPDEMAIPYFLPLGVEPHGIRRV